MSQPQQLIECEDCGRCYAASPAYPACCPECEHQLDEEAEATQRQYWLELAQSCRCGAWGVTATGNTYRIADCVCGAYHF